MYPTVHIYNITGMQPQVEKSLLLQLILPETARTFQTPRHGRRATSCPGATGKTAVSLHHMVV